MNMFRAAACAVLLAATAQAASAAVIAGPTLNSFEGGWQFSGIEFVAQQDATLTSFVFQNQGNASTILLTDENGVTLHSTNTAAGNTSLTVNVNWALTSGFTYRLLREGASNSKYAVFGAALPSNADIAITRSGIFGHSVTDVDQFGANEYWSSFNDITTGGGSGAVPEPGTWALMILGFGGAGVALRGRRRAFAEAA